MVRVIMGNKGAGKTKQVIEILNKAVETEHGNVVCIESGKDLTFNISHRIRLVEAKEYDIADYTALKGFISGLYAGNYDITHILIENLLKITKSPCDSHTENFLAWLSAFGTKHNIKFTVTISDDASLAPDGVKKFI